MSVPVNKARRVRRLRMDERTPIWMVAGNILNKQSSTAYKVWSSSWGLGDVLITPDRKNVSCYEMFTKGRALLNKLMNLRFP
jgi:hypothetical protein